MDYEFWNFFVNCCVAVGTIATVVTAICLSIPKKEKATGYFEIEFLDRAKNYMVFTVPMTSSFSKTRLNFLLNNNGKVNIILNRDLGAFLKIKNKSINLTLSALIDKDIFVPKKMHKSFSILLPDDDRIAELYSNKDCVLSVYTARGTEIELIKNSGGN